MNHKTEHAWRQRNVLRLCTSLKIVNNEQLKLKFIHKSEKKLFNWGTNYESQDQNNPTCLYRLIKCFEAHSFWIKIVNTAQNDKST